MFLSQIQNYLKKSTFFAKLPEILSKKEINICCKTQVAKALTLAQISSISKKPLIFVTNSNWKANLFSSDLDILSENIAKVFPDYETLFYENRAPFYSLSYQRIETLNFALENQNLVYCLSFRSFMQKIISRKMFSEMIFKIALNDELDISLFFSNLIKIGYTPNFQVEKPGEIAKRGDIVDIFLPNMEKPLRIDFFCDIVEKIRFFDINTQISEKKVINSLEILPVKELNLDKINTNPEQWELIHKDGFYEGIENNLPVLYADLQNFADYLKNVIVVWDSFDLKAQYENLLQQAMKNWNGKNYLPAPQDLFMKYEKIFSYKNIFFSDDPKDKNCFSLNDEFAPQSGNLEIFEQILQSKLSENYKVFIQTENQSQQDRIKEIFFEKNYKVDFSLGMLSESFLLKDAKLLIFSEADIFGLRKVVKYKQRFSLKNKISDYHSLKIGDYIVHVNYGIGIFSGLKKLLINSAEFETLVLTYDNKSTVYLPTYALEKISLYVAQDGFVPSLSNLSSKKWEKQKEKAQKQVEEIAHDIVNLYAQRAVQEGISFDEDSIWQSQMEDSFMYEPTGDQKRAVEEIKRDMILAKPMERLLCGDVGFGKTEVAIRAAFKAVLSGFQVAVLAPTTLLCEQLFNVFKERLALFPVKIAMLSRFVSRNEAKNTLLKTAEGKIDIVVGTHRLFSADVKFKKLGFLIIDEEHRFGIRHKEKLRKLAVNIDTLYMSATPIPRTLNMALLGMKKMSLIQTSPKARLIIDTSVCQFNDDLIISIIEKEINRHGQVFFVHNRVQTINLMAEKLQELMPDYKFKVAHGQLPEKDLEKVMQEFYHHEFDVLVTSAIIESGIDIPNVNTLIINDAHKFGLSQLYQLRGRVGRSDKKAYAYFLVPKKLSKEQLARLKTISDFNFLGSGYQIALRDMEIRGVGNILGTKQSGIIRDIGYNYFNSLLNKSIENIKEGKILNVKKEKTVDIQATAFIPETYVSSETERLNLYRRISNLKNEKEFSSFKTELIDRFGEIPFQIENSLKIVKIHQIVDEKENIISIILNSSKLVLEMSENIGKKKIEKIVKKKIEKIVKKINYPLSFDFTKNIKIIIDLNKDKAFLDKAKKILEVF